MSADEAMDDAAGSDHSASSGRRSPSRSPSPDGDQQSSSPGPAQQQLLAAFESDAAIQALRPLLLARLRLAVESLHTAIESEMVAHALTLYRYTRLQQKLMAAKGWTRIRAAQQLNPWIAAAYGEQGQELVARLKHDAHRLFDLFSEPADDDEW